MISTCTENLALEDVDVILTTGHHPIPNRLLPLPVNFHHEPYLPGLLMAEAADLLIHHGGYGSSQTALYAGKPSVILPTYSERLGNARRIESLGAAAVVAVHRDSGRRVVDAAAFRGAVHDALNCASYRNRAAELGDLLRSFGEAHLAAQRIDAFARQTVSASRAAVSGAEEASLPHTAMRTDPPCPGDEDNG